MTRLCGLSTIPLLPLARHGLTRRVRSSEPSGVMNTATSSGLNLHADDRLTLSRLKRVIEPADPIQVPQDVLADAEYDRHEVVSLRPAPDPLWSSGTSLRSPGRRGAAAKTISTEGSIFNEATFDESRKWPCQQALNINAAAPRIPRRRSFSRRIRGRARSLRSRSSATSPKVERLRNLGPD